MNAAEAETIKRNLARLSRDINYQQLVDELRARGIVSSADDSFIKANNPLPKGRNIDLLELLMTKSDVWKVLMDCLNNSGHSALATLLETEYRDKVQSRICSAQRDNPEKSVEEIVESLRRRLISDYMQRTPTVFHSLDSSFSDATYVTLKIVRQEKRKQDSEEEPWANARRGHAGEGRLQPETISGNDEIFRVLLNEIRLTPIPLFIIGKPGQGKTTLVRKLAYDWAKAQSGIESNDVLKGIDLLFAFSLRNLIAKHESILDFILAPTALPSFTASALESVKKWALEHLSRVVVILDGLDEIRGECDELLNITSNPMIPVPPHVPLIITTRPHAMPQECLWPTRYEVCELNAEQARELVEKHGVGHPKAFVDELMKYCQGKENSFVLSSPLLVHLLCWTVLLPRSVSDQHTPLDLPHSRTAMYLKILHWLSLRRDQKRKGQCDVRLESPILEGDLISVLSALAFWAQTSNRLVFDESEVDALCGHQRVGTDSATASLNSEQRLVAEAMELGYVVADPPFYGSAFRSEPRRRQLMLSFAHKTLQEFFAANEIVRKLSTEDEEGDVESFLRGNDDDDNDVLLAQEQVLLFAIGIACETKSTAARKILQLEFELVLTKVCKRQSLLAEKSTLAFLKAFFRETTAFQREALKVLAKDNARAFDRILKDIFHNNFFNIFIAEYKIDFESFFESVNTLLPLGVGFSQLRLINVAGFRFLFTQELWSQRDYDTLADDDEQISVFEISQADADRLTGHVKLAEEAKRVTIRRFRFCGTTNGLASFLSGIEVCAQSSELAIRMPTNSPSSVGRCRHEEQRTQQAADNAVSFTFRRIDKLMLWTKLDAREVRNLFALLSSTAAADGEAQIDELNFIDDTPYAAETDVVCQTVTDADDASANSSTTATISVSRLWRDDLGTVPTLSTFEAVLMSVRHIQIIRMRPDALSLLYEFERVRNDGRREGRLASVHLIHFCWDRNFKQMVDEKDSQGFTLSTSTRPPCILFAKSIAEFSASVLQINFIDSSDVTKESFGEFCTVLADEEKKQGAALILLEIWTLSKIEPCLPTIVDSLIQLLRALHNLHIEFHVHNESDEQFAISLFQSDLKDRVAVDTEQLNLRELLFPLSSTDLSGSRRCFFA